MMHTPLFWNEHPVVAGQNSAQRTYQTTSDTAHGANNTMNKIQLLATDLASKLPPAQKPSLRQCHSQRSLRSLNAPAGSPIEYIPVVIPSSKDNTLLHGRFWRSSVAEPHGIVTIIHGMGEHSGRYKDMAIELNKRGFHVLGFDHRGHGLSQGQRGVLDDYNELHQDIKDHAQFAHTLCPNLPHTTYAHSMGGGLLLNHLIEHSDESDISKSERFIVTSPWLRLRNPISSVLQSGVWLASQVRKNFTIDMAAKSKKNGQGIQIKNPFKDPLSHKLISANWFMGSQSAGYRSLDTAHHLAQSVQEKLILLHSIDDPITDPVATEMFANRANALFVQMKDYGHSPHNISRKHEYFDMVSQYLPQLKNTDRKADL